MNGDSKEISYSGFWARSLAALIDWVPLILLLYLVGFGMGHIAAAIGTGEIYLRIAANLIGLVAPWLYFTLFECSERQATPGKMLLGIKVTDLQGSRISFLRATGRYAAKGISIVIGFAGFIMAGFTGKKQGLHDIIAGCLVVKCR